MERMSKTVRSPRYTEEKRAKSSKKRTRLQGKEVQYDEKYKRIQFDEDFDR